jgi:F-type H+-transporting ATPase subunit gamma
MANRRVLVKRRKAVGNIRKITRTMQLIATARFQAAFQRAVASRPYTDKLSEIARELAATGASIEHPLLQPGRPDAPSCLVVITSSRGLCGGYNANVLRAAQARLEEWEREGRPTELHVFGKKGISYFRFQQRPMAVQSTAVGDRPRFQEVEPIANRLMDGFVSGELRTVEVAYMRFYSAGRQRPEVFQLLPLASPAAPQASEEKVGSRSIQWEIRPDPVRLLAQLLPASVRVRLLQAFLDAAVSEQIARMVAMKAATEASGEMIKSLTRQYNRARQTHITMELLDIVGGANALA